MCVFYPCIADVTRFVEALEKDLKQDDPGEGSSDAAKPSKDKSKKDEKDESSEKKK